MRMIPLTHTRLYSALASVWVFPAALLANHPHTDPENTGNWVLRGDISDEFNGESIDLDKWFIQGLAGEFQNDFIGRAPSQFTPHNVSVEDGFFKIRARWEPDYDFSDKVNHGRTYEKITTGAIISKARFLYGYMEVRARANKSPISSSFWSTGKGGEIDVFEHWGKDEKKSNLARKYQSSLHDWRDQKSSTWGKRIWSNDHLLESPVADEFHIYALEWDPDYLRIYVDGRLIRYVTRDEIGDAWVATHEQKIWLSSEIFPWKVDLKNLSAADYPDDGRAFTVDYVRIWQRAELDTAPDPVAPQNLLTNPSFESGKEGWSLDGSAEWISGTHALSGTAAIQLDGTGRLERTVKLKPNTTYILSAWAKVPESNRKKGWKHAFLGVKGYGGERIRQTFFRPTYDRMSLEFTTGANSTEGTLFFTNEGRGDQAIVDDFELYESSSLKK